MLALWLQLGRMALLNLRFFKVATFAVSAAVLLSQPNKLLQSGLHGSLMAGAESAAVNGVPDTIALGAIYPTPESIIPRIDVLRSAKLSVFRDGNALPHLGQNVSDLIDVQRDCIVKVVAIEPRADHVLWRAQLTSGPSGGDWRIVYVERARIAGIGIREDTGAIHLLGKPAARWIGYAPGTPLIREGATFGLLSQKRMELIGCTVQ
jgi:hypothetical protein